jgi:hypothetical protein
VDGVLFIHHWQSTGLEANFDRFTRVGVPGHVVLSVLEAEQSYDEETSTWKDNEDNPYGDYWMRLERQTQ